MSVLVTIRVPGDTNQFRQFMQDNPDRVTGLADNARRGGCLHHRFALGDGFVLVIDEWESAEQFEQFFADPQIAQVMPQMGAQGEPEITFAEAVATPDQF